MCKCKEYHPKVFEHELLPVLEHYSEELNEGDYEQAENRDC
jgi:hypothetical protein